MKKQILLVDDDKRLLRYLQFGLASGLGEDCSVTAFTSPLSAVEHAKNHKPDLVISDINMPKMNGIQLFKYIHQLYAEAQFILMADDETTQLEQEEHLISDIMVKPFRMSELIEAVHSSFKKKPQPIILGATIVSENIVSEIQKVLEKLRVKMSPEMILLADISGYIIANQGIISGLDLNSVVTLVAGGFAAANELDNLIAQNRASNEEAPSQVDDLQYITYQEGRSYDYYATYLGQDLFLLLLFNKSSKHKGAAWVYLRQAAKELQKIIQQLNNQLPADLANNKLQNVTTSFNRLFAEELEKQVN